MDEQQLLALFRGIERILIELGAITTIVLGTLLYRWGVQGPPKAGGGDVEASGAGFAFKLTNAAPGSVLAAFGMIVLSVGMASPLKLSRKDTHERTQRESSHDTGGGSEGDGGRPTAGEHTAGTTDKHVVEESATYRNLPGVVGLEIDALGGLIAPPAGEAGEILSQHRRDANTLLVAQPQLPTPVVALLQSVRDAPAVEGKAARLKLEELAAAARKLKAELSQHAGAP